MSTLNYDMLCNSQGLCWSVNDCCWPSLAWTSETLLIFLLCKIDCCFQWPSHGDHIPDIAPLFLSQWQTDPCVLGEAVELIILIIFRLLLILSDSLGALQQPVYTMVTTHWIRVCISLAILTSQGMEVVFIQVPDCSTTNKFCQLKDTVTPWVFHNVGHGGRESESQEASLHWPRECPWAGGEGCFVFLKSVWSLSLVVDVCWLLPL